MATPRNYAIGTVKVSAFDNVVKDKQGNDKQIKSFKITKSYKTEDGEWKETQSLTEQDLLKLPALIQRAVEKELVRYN